MIITLELPPSKNERLTYAPRLHMLVATTKYRAWKEQARTQLLVCYGFNGFNKKRAPTYEEQMIIDITVYLSDKRRDGANIMDALLDAMTGFVYTDDRWVVPRFNRYIIDKAHPRVEVSF